MWRIFRTHGERAAATTAAQAYVVPATATTPTTPFSAPPPPTVPSSNARGAHLSTQPVGQGLVPTYAPDVTAYTCVVPAAQRTLAITASTESALATQSLCVGDSEDQRTCAEPFARGAASSAITLGAPGTTTNLYWRIQAQDGTTVANTRIAVYRISNQTGLAALTMSPEGSGLAFQPNQTTYTVELPPGASDVTFQVAPTDARATLKWRFDQQAYIVPPNGVSDIVLANVSVGVHTLDIVLTAEDQITTRTYRVTMTRLGG